MRLTRYISLRFIGVAVLVMLLSIPASYYIIRKIMQKNVDENLLFQKEWIISQMQNNRPESQILSHNISVKETSNNENKQEGFSTESLFDEKNEDYANHRIYGFYKVINGKPYHFRLKYSLVENEKILRTIALLQTSVLLILILSLMLINRQVENKIWKPFYRMLKALKQYRIDHQNFEIPPKSPVKEMNDLSVSLAELTDNNQKLFAAQKEFTENASHELQTPVAVIQNKLEMLMQTEPLTEQQSMYIADIFATNQKLAKMNRSLLTLAKIENHQFEDMRNVSLMEIIEKVASDTAFLAEDKNIEILTFFETDKEIAGNETLLNILFGNLVSNAIKYTDTGGSISIWLTANTFEIANTSELEKLNEDLLFKRFQKQNSHRESTGLGLEICNRICKIYNWELSYRHTANLHRFSINF